MQILILTLWAGPGLARSEVQESALAQKAEQPQIRSDALRPQLIRDESDVLFDSPTVFELRLQLKDAEVQRLREDGRQYVQCDLVEEGGAAIAVSLKLKGAAGSFQELDDAKPAFTINVAKRIKQQRFYGLKKFYLNNSVQDDSYFCEWLSSRLCRELNLPAPRINFARVFLNDRDLGLYVLKEGFDDRFIKRHFNISDGYLFDGGFCQDIDIDLEEDLAATDNRQPSLVQLREACLQPEAEPRQIAVEKHLNLDAFISFMAFEMMACHWDGYVGNSNNYRVYIPSSGGAWFLPHGMDQMFQDPNYSVFEPRNSIVGRTVRGRDEWNELFRQRVRDFLPKFEPQRLIGLIEQLDQRLRPEFRKSNPDSDGWREQVLEDWRARLTQRFASLEMQLTLPDPPVHNPEEAQPLEMEIGQTVELTDWFPRQESDEVTISVEDSEVSDEDASTTVFSIAVEGTGQRCIASWRRAVILAPGVYRLSAELRVKGVKRLTDDDRGPGAGVRISGASRDQGLVGSSGWKDATFDFSVEEDFQRVELVCELRASTGMSQMRNAKLTRLEP